MAGSDYESVLCVKNEVFVYQIPARTSNRGYRAADWNLDKPDWVGRLKVAALGQTITIRLEDKNSGELFAQCPVDSYPSIAVEQVLDSSRYFVIRITDPSGRKAFIGIGFADRGDSFDLLVAMQDHFKWLNREEKRKVEENQSVDSLSSGPKLDLGFKEGQTIKLNLSTKREGDENSPSSKPRSRPQASGGGVGILPPPPGSAAPRLAPPPRAPAAVADAPSIPSNHGNQATSSSGGLLDMGIGSGVTHTGASGATSGGSNNLDFLLTQSSGTGTGLLQPQAPQPDNTQNSDPWGDFTSAAGSSNPASSQSSNWVNFE